MNGVSHFMTKTKSKLLKAMGLTNAAFLNRSLLDERMSFTSPIKIFFGILSFMPAVTASQPFSRPEVWGIYSKIRPEPNEPLTIPACSVWLMRASTEKLELVISKAVLESLPT